MATSFFTLPLQNIMTKNIMLIPYRALDGIIDQQTSSIYQSRGVKR